MAERLLAHQRFETRRVDLSEAELRRRDALDLVGLAHALASNLQLLRHIARVGRILLEGAARAGGVSGGRKERAAGERLNAGLRTFCAASRWATTANESSSVGMLEEVSAGLLRRRRPPASKFL